MLSITVMFNMVMVKNLEHLCEFLKRPSLAVVNAIH